MLRAAIAGDADEGRSADLQHATFGQRLGAVTPSARRALRIGFVTV